jgi:aryl-alcohol dehydrogenase-like predicted oxidoreductase
MNFGERTDEAQSIALIDRALDVGINFLDTANVYSRGRSEEIIGKALQRNGQRARVILATKVFGRMREDDPNAWGNHRRHIIEQCDASLKRLQTDHIDPYQIHKPISAIPIDETLRALDDLVRAGKVLYVGTTTFAAWQIVESLWVSKEYGLNRVISEQTAYNLLDRRAERELFPMTQAYGIGVLVWSPLARGFLTGKYQRGDPDPNRSAWGAWGATWVDRYQLSPAAFEVADMVQTIAEEKGVRPSTVALAWCLHQPGITCPIIGPRTMAQLEEYLGALSVQITDEDCERLNRVAPPGGVITPYYEADFRTPRFRW